MNQEKELKKLGESNVDTFHNTTYGRRLSQQNAYKHNGDHI